MKNSDLENYWGIKGGYVPLRGVGNGSRKIIQMLCDFPSPIRILDVGCAEGEILKPITRLHAIYGVEVGEQFCRDAVNNGFRECKQVDLEEHPIPYADEMFDVTFSCDTLEHIVDTDWVLCEMNRVTRFGGTIMLCLPSIRTPISLLAFMFNRVPMFGARYRSSHVRDFTSRSIRRALSNRGFTVTEQIGVDFCATRNPEGVLPWLATYIPSWCIFHSFHVMQFQQY